MKTLIKLLVLLVAVLQINNVLAAESITGTWQGKLVMGPDAELKVQFIIDQAPDGSYSVVLNSPDEGGIKNIEANEVVYDAGILKLEVSELSGSYEGVVKDGTIDGEWKQEGTSMPLSLSPYVKPTLSKEDKKKLLGEWHGELTIPTGSLTVVFRFEMAEKDEFVGLLDVPDYGDSALNIPITDMEMSDGILSLKISSIKGEYKGELSDNEMVGEFKQGATPLPLTLKKGEYKAQVNRLSLSQEYMEKLLGEWHGELTIPTGSLTVVFRFEMAEKDEFVGFIDSPDQGAKGIPITEANMSDGKLILKIKSLGGEFKGELSKDKIVGDWTQGGMTNPLTLNKGEYVAPVYKLSLPEEAMDQLAGKWNGKLDDLDVIFRFEKVKSGDFEGFVDMPRLKQKDLPITDASLSEGKLTLKIKAAIAVEFIGQLSRDKLVGEWKPPTGNSTPLTLTKEKP